MSRWHKESKRNEQNQVQQKYWHNEENERIQNKNQRNSNFHYIFDAMNAFTAELNWRGVESSQLRQAMLSENHFLKKFAVYEPGV